MTPAAWSAVSDSFIEAQAKRIAQDPESTLFALSTAVEYAPDEILANPALWLLLLEDPEKTAPIVRAAQAFSRVRRVQHDGQANHPSLCLSGCCPVNFEIGLVAEAYESSHHDKYIGLNEYTAKIGTYGCAQSNHTIAVARSWYLPYNLRPTAMQVVGSDISATYRLDPFTHRLDPCEHWESKGNIRAYEI
jgi:hypothetical protein